MAALDGHERAIQSRGVTSGFTAARTDAGYRLSYYAVKQRHGVRKPSPRDLFTPRKARSGLTFIVIVIYVKETALVLVTG
ncbi:unnamed protein product, partial [Iphiclides podalirius]